MHMLMLMGMHMHPMLRIRFDRNAPISAPAAQDWIGAKRTEADIGLGAWRKLGVMDTKKAGRAAPPGESLFSSLFYVAARGGKSPRHRLCSSV
jgi:hypothetical protein